MTGLVAPGSRSADAQAGGLRSERAGFTAVIATARLELTLALRSKGFWTVQAILLAPALLAFVYDGGETAHLRYASNQLRQLIAFGLLLLPLLALPSLGRARGVRGDLTFTTTHDSLAHALGTLLGIYAWLVPSVLLHLVARWALGKMIGGQASWTLLTVGPWTTLAALTLGLGVLACLSVALRRTLPLLLVWLGLWFLSLARSGGLFGGTVDANLPLIDPVNVFYEGLMLSPSTALGLAQPLVTALAAWFALLGSALLALWLILLPRFDVRRADRSRFAPLMMALVASGAAVWAHRSLGDEVVAQAPVPTPQSVRLDAWHVLERDLDIVFVPEGDTKIQGTARLTLAPALTAPGDWPPATLALRLRPGMTAAIRVSEPTGERTLPSSREGDSLLVDLGGPPGEATGVLVVTIDFEGEPIWPYTDHRSQRGWSFPFLDSPQPVTAAAYAGVGYLLRDGDWQPWPWTTHAQVAEGEDRVTVRVESPDEPARTYEYASEIPQLLAVAAPRRASGDTADQQYAGRDPGAGVVRALSALERNAPGLWSLLGETTTPIVAALPYLLDVYANAITIAIPEAVDTRNGVFLSPIYQAWSEPGVADRVATYVSARAWLNGRSQPRRGFAVADLEKEHFRSERGSGMATRAGTEHRLLQVPQLGVLRAPWASIWFGADPNLYDVSPFSLWLAVETADEQVRRDDLALLRGLSGKTQDVFDLSDRGLPWNLYMNPGTVRIVLALVDWSEQVGSGTSVRLFADTYRQSRDHSQQFILAALGEASGVPVEVEIEEARR